jgi:peptidyl-prolyl cis-trans isomerase A (cyclophilin A)
MIRRTFLFAAFVALAACGSKAPPIVHTGTAPDSFRVNFETSRGNVAVEVYRAWAPQGADRFYALVQNHFFDDNRFFRVVPGFIVQFGLNGNPKVSEQWDDKIPDDSVRQTNARGTLTFATEGPGSRTHQLFFNTGENSRLDKLGFAPIGRVVDGMAVVDSINAQYGEEPEQHFIQRMGNEYLNRMFPKLDYIKTVTYSPTSNSSSK